jgi:hypothetical protein
MNLKWKVFFLSFLLSYLLQFTTINDFRLIIFNNGDLWAIDSFKFISSKKITITIVSKYLFGFIDSIIYYLWSVTIDTWCLLNNIKQINGICTRVGRSLVFRVDHFCLFFFCWPLCCLSFDLRHLIAPFEYSKISLKTWGMRCSGKVSIFCFSIFLLFSRERILYINQLHQHTKILLIPAHSLLDIL